MALRLMKGLLREQLHNLPPERLAVACDAGSGLEEIHGAVGRDHWVVTPCERTSLAPGTTGRVMEGTRLTIVAKAPDGYEFSIRTPGTPGRWKQFDEELCAVWGALTAAVCAREGATVMESDPGGEDEDLSDLVLKLFYYWVNFGPLSRGSAACGYIVMVGLLMALGWELNKPLPPGVQMDWEAILRPTPELFMEVSRPWLHSARHRRDVLAGVPDVLEAFPTVLEALKALSCP
ncbi:unnamed protein product [Discosporangium mesarthrocarpum]